MPGGGGSIDLTVTQDAPGGAGRGAAELDASGLVCGDPGGGTICFQVLISG